MRNFVSIIFFASFLSGCTPSFNFSVPDIVTSKQKINASLKDVTISYGDRKPTDPLILIQPDDFSKESLNQEIVPAWFIALCNALKKSKLFNKSAEKNVSLLVTVQEIDIPIFGIDFTTLILANYKLIDNSNNEVIYSDLVKSEETVEFSYSLIGQIRAVESVNRAVRRNISTFISNIQSHPPLLDSISPARRRPITPQKEFLPQTGPSAT